ncbi:MAG: hypothetical protein J6J13_04555, partial [Clostridia bacterium]|nr:hypothetical protein [Clostridia bacterium]
MVFKGSSSATQRISRYLELMNVAKTGTVASSVKTNAASDSERNLNAALSAVTGQKTSLQQSENGGIMNSNNNSGGNANAKIFDGQGNFRSGEQSEKTFSRTQEESRNAWKEDGETFARRNSGAQQKSGRKIRNIGKSIFAYTPKAADWSDASNAVEILKAAGINAIYCEGMTESNKGGITVSHYEAVTAPDGTVYVSSTASLSSVNMAAHEAVHVNQKGDTKAYAEYQSVVCENIKWGSDGYLNLARKIFDNHHRSKIEQKLQRKLSETEINDIINSVEYVSKFLTELTAYINGHVSENSQIATKEFSSIFSDWNAVVEASQKFNEDIGLDFISLRDNKATSEDGAAFSMPENSSEGDYGVEGEINANEISDAQSTTSDSERNLNAALSAVTGQKTSLQQSENGGIMNSRGEKNGSNNPELLGRGKISAASGSRNGVRKQGKNTRALARLVEILGETKGRGVGRLAAGESGWMVRSKASKQDATGLEEGILRDVSKIDLTGKDTTGRILSEEVKQRFKDTIFKDEDGNILSLYHWTAAEFDVFEKGDIGFHLGTIDAAHDRYSQTKEENPDTPDGIYKETYCNITKPIELKDYSGNWAACDVAEQLREAGIISQTQYDELSQLDGWWDETYDNPAMNAVRDILKDNGYDGIIYRNQSEDVGSFSAIALYPNQIITIAENGVLKPDCGVSEATSETEAAFSMPENSSEGDYDVEGEINANEISDAQSTTSDSERNLNAALSAVTGQKTPLQQSADGGTMSASQQNSSLQEMGNENSNDNSLEIEDSKKGEPLIPPTSELMDLIQRLQNGEDISIEEINADPVISQLLDEASSRTETYTINTPERAAIRKNVAQKLLALGSATVDSSGKVVYNDILKQERRADIVIGLSAAGKSSVLVDPLSEYYSSRVIDSDMAKEELPEFDNGIGANAVHRESQDIIDDVLGDSLKKGENIVWPIVGGNKVESLIAKIQLLKDNGYSVYLHLNELPNGKAIGRALNRYVETGRFIPPGIIKQYGDTPTQNFNTIINTEGLVDGYSHYSNDVARGEKPKLIKISENVRQFDERRQYGIRRETQSQTQSGGPKNLNNETNVATSEDEAAFSMPENSAEGDYDVEGDIDSTQTAQAPQGGNVEVEEEYYENWEDAYLDSIQSMVSEPDLSKEKISWIDGMADEIVGHQRKTEGQMLLFKVAKKLGWKIGFADLYKRDKNGKVILDEDGEPQKANSKVNKAKKEIIFDYDCKSPFKELLKHELTHFLETNVTAYHDFANAVMNSRVFQIWVLHTKKYESVEAYNKAIRTAYKGTQGFESETDAEYQGNLEAKREAELQAEHSANLEMVAEFVAEMLFEKGHRFLNRLALELSPESRKANGAREAAVIVWERLKTLVEVAIRKLKSAFANVSKKSSWEIVKLEEEWIKTYKKAEAAWQEQQKAGDNIDKRNSNDVQYSLINNQFPPFNESQSDANEWAARWALSDEVEVGDQRLASYHNRWYLIEKFDDVEFGYRIMERLTKKTYEYYKGVIGDVRDFKRPSFAQTADRISSGFGGRNINAGRDGTIDNNFDGHTRENTDVRSMGEIKSKTNRNRSGDLGLSRTSGQRNSAQSGNTSNTAKKEADLEESAFSMSKSSQNSQTSTEQKTTVDDSGGWQYSLNVNAKSELHKALYDKNYRNEVLLRDNTPPIMLSQKGVKNLPMVMNASHIRENVFTEEEAKNLGLRVDKNKNYHGIGETNFLKIIDSLDGVKEAYRGTKNASDSARRENYFLLITEFKDENQNTINVPVFIDEHAQYNRVFIKTNKIATVFGRDNFR